ncbi:leucine-rich repeat protein [Thalassiosira pseudonana CCMP1335]|uniref:Dynein axonemal light chain 1 n=1 Tax=Thalassiosira pseudonana TaxID=35128 RepID=B8C6D5_THAPS|nr:leucine-rich repeat protein [Thalassiosira pseudonana CCMP1335]EED90787.1 leucine-rich repeat protein [Thalassiosira pseudonana CCMP1335]|eukprot:scaffold2667_cov196-Alexandrium_tamarense.AAC.8
MTTCAQAIKNWEANPKNEGSVEEATEVSLCFQAPPITKLDAKVLNNLKKCQKLSLSTNMIERMISLTGMSELKILSIGRNNIKKIEKLEDVASSLQQLWISYNQISSLDGLACVTGLTTLYCSNNLIKSFSELDKLKANEQLRDVLFIGNPMYSEVATKEEARIEILRHLPNLKKIDGEFVKPSELEAAQQAVTSD